MLHNNTTMEMDELYLYTAIDSYNHNAAEKKPYTRVPSVWFQVYKVQKQVKMLILSGN